MNTLLHWLTSPEWALIVKALLHSLWQGAAIAVALALLLRRIAGPEARYRLAVAGLGAVLLSATITWGVLNVPTQSAAPVAPMPEMNIAEIPVATGPVEKIVVAANWTPARQQTQWTAWLALVWLLGASAMLGRASVKVAGAEQLRRSCQPLNDPRIADLVAEARRAVKLTRQVRIAVTNQLTSPAVVGVLVPTLILPLSLLTTLSPEQLRFILLHELAHIRRGDYLANLFQLFAEALLFFNPAVWWLSHQVRREREACCDALAIELSGAPADYARTLVSVAETMLNPSPAVAPAFGSEREPSSLADRVQRVLVPGYRPSLRLTWRAMLTALVAGGVLLGLLAAGTRETVAATAALLEPKLASSKSSDAYSMSKPATINAATGLPGSGAGAINPATGLPERGTTNPVQKVIPYVSEDGFTVQMVVPTAISDTNSIAKPTTINPATGLLGGDEKAINPITGLPGADALRINPATGLPEASGTNQPALYSRTFKVDTNEFAQALGMAGPVTATNFQSTIRNFFSSLGVDLSAPGKSVYYNARRGMLIVRASLTDLDIIEQVLQVMNTAAPQVNIRAKFVEVPGDGSGNLFLGTLGSAFTNSNGGKPANLGGNAIGPAGTNNPMVAGLTGILTPVQFKVVMRALEQREDVEILSSPDVTTVSGRQAQLQVVDIRTIVSGLSTVTATNGTSTNVFQTSAMPFGPVLDVVPYVSADGFTVNMTLIPTVTEFVGYQKPDPTLTKFAKEKSVNAELPLPIYRMRHATTSATVWDGQTIVIGGFTSEIVTRQPDGSKTKKPDPKPQKNQLFVFITPTIIDPAGNRVHTDEEMPPSTNSVPKQPGK